MGKISRKLSGLLVAIAIAPFTALPIQATIRQHPSPIVTEVTDNYLAVSFSEIWKRLRRKKVPAGSRGDETEWFTCAIVPGKLIDSETREETTIKVWNPRPLFLWRGTWARLEVRHLRSGELMWRQTLAPTQQRLVYGDDGKPLQPGQAYYWQLIPEGLPEDTLLPRISFRIIGVQERDRITDELENLTAESADTLTLARVHYFIDQGLWADALHEIYSHPDQFSGLIEQIEAHDFCGNASASP